MKISVLFSPQEVDQLRRQDLTGKTCVVFDVLRATSTMLAAFAEGAHRIKPVSTIEEAITEKQSDPTILLAGERHGRRIGAELTGGTEFDLGNSPREMKSSVVSGRTIVTTTTNGTRAIRACAHADTVVIASFANLGVVSRSLGAADTEELLLVCSGTGEDACLEDAAGAGALVNRLEETFPLSKPDDSAIIARNCFLEMRNSLLKSVSEAVNARRLLEIPNLAEDVAWCLNIDQFGFVPTLDRKGYLLVP